MEGELTPESLNKSISDTERERREDSAIRQLYKKSQGEIKKLEDKVDLLTAIDNIEISPPDWAQPRGPKTRQRGIANLMLSDMHFDEVVDFAEMRGKNSYNREIALKRLHKLGDNTIKIARDYMSGVRYDGLYIWCNGDGVSGNIHEELERTNDGVHPMESVDFWSDHVAAFFVQQAEYFGKVHLVWSYGNHGRNYKKPPSKGAVKSSWDWQMARTIWRELQSDDRFTWNIPESLDVVETQYKTRYLMTHGDAFKGGDQIAGAVRPVTMGDYRQLVVEIADDGAPYDVLLVGHFHQYHALPRAIINGSLIGYNEYAKGKRFRPEVPKQAFWVTTPDHGPSFHTPILPLDRRKEKW